LKHFSNLFLALGGGILLWAAWPVSPFTFLIFIAWIPLLWLEIRVKSKRKFFGLTYITMLTWNVATTWWIWNASEPGALAAFFANSFLMCFPWLGFKIIRKRFGENTGYLSLVAFWMCFEFFHLQDWGLSWPWLTLGNVFATHAGWIQWYEYTGTSGGTLWVLAVNILLFIFIKYNFIWRTQKTLKHVVIVVPILLIPIFVSWLDGFQGEFKAKTANIVVVQPNIDPYEKISAGTFDAQLGKLIHLSEQAIDSSTSLLVWPETALYTGSLGGIDEEKMKENYFLAPLWDLLRRYPHLNLFTGIESYRAYSTHKTSTARFASPGLYYDSFNSSVLLDSTGPLGFYHKSMLVPGVETLPWFLRFIDTWFDKFGGTTAGYAKQKERTVLATSNGYKIAPAICYESIYGEFMSDYISNGANLICIITNDGWWQNTPGYKQHMNYARLRAIETRTWIARSANTGISCFIDPFGHVSNPQPWDKAAAIKMSVPIHNNKTFFVNHGDIISRAMVIISGLIILWTIGTVIRSKFFS
jgi:apolipoprotein N-acyltransferase